VRRSTTDLKTPDASTPHSAFSFARQPVDIPAGRHIKTESKQQRPIAIWQVG
jgi:hypothetical protein